MSSADSHPNSTCRQSIHACFLIANTAMILLMLTNQHTEYTLIAKFLFFLWFYDMFIGYLETQVADHRRKEL
jgi:hypothetical protein